MTRSQIDVAVVALVSCGAVFATAWGIIFTGIYRPVSWAKRYDADQLNAWNMRAPAFGPPAGLAISCAALLLPASSDAIRSALLALTLMLSGVALFLALRFPAWARPRWIVQGDLQPERERRGERIMYAIGAVEFAAFAYMLIRVEGLSGYSLGAISLGIGAAISAARRTGARRA